MRVGATKPSQSAAKSGIRPKRDGTKFCAGVANFVPVGKVLCSKKGETVTPCTVF